MLSDLRSTPSSVILMTGESYAENVEFAYYNIYIKSFLALKVFLEQFRLLIQFYNQF